MPQEQHGSRQSGRQDVEQTLRVTRPKGCAARGLTKRRVSVARPGQHKCRADRVRHQRLEDPAGLGPHLVDVPAAPARSQHSAIRDLIDRREADSERASSVGAVLLVAARDVAEAVKVAHVPKFCQVQAVLRRNVLVAAVGECRVVKDQ